MTSYPSPQANEPYPAHPQQPYPPQQQPYPLQQQQHGYYPPPQQQQQQQQPYYPPPQQQPYYPPPQQQMQPVYNPAWVSPSLYSAGGSTPSPQSTTPSRPSKKVTSRDDDSPERHSTPNSDKKKGGLRFEDTPAGKRSSTARGSAIKQLGELEHNLQIAHGYIREVRVALQRGERISAEAISNLQTAEESVLEHRRQLTERTDSVTEAVDAAREKERENEQRAARADRMKELKKETCCGLTAKTCQSCERADKPCKPWCRGHKQDLHILDCKNPSGCYDENGAIQTQLNVLMRQSKISAASSN